MHLGRGFAALAGMGLVNQQRKLLTAQVAQLIQDERELLHRGHDDLLALAQEGAQLGGILRMTKDGRNVVIALDGAGDLRVQRAPVGDDDDRIKLGLHRIGSGFQLHQLMRQPRNGVALATACRMLDQVTLADPILTGAAQQGAHGAQLMKAREHLLAPLLAPLGPGALFVFFLHQLGEVFDDVGQRALGQHLFPQVIGLQAVRIGWVACAAVPSLVERQKPRCLAGQMRAKPHLGIVHRHVRHAAPQLEQQLMGVAVGLVLHDGVGHRLLGQRIFQLKSQHRQAVDEDPQVQRTLRFVVAVAQLPGDAEHVLAKILRCAGIARRGQQLVQINMRRAVAHPFAQHIHHSALAHFALDAVQKLRALDAFLPQFQRGNHRWLRGLQKRQQLHHVQRHVAVVVRCAAQHIAPWRIRRQRLARRLTRSLG